MDATIRRASPDDAEAIRAFTRDTWPEREGGDYLPSVIDDWIASDGDDQRTLVAAVDGRAAGVVQAVLLSPWEAWLQGRRVDPDHRGRGLARRLTHAAFDWAADRGATVARNMVFSWNVDGLGLSRAAGFEPAAEFRWAHPEPDETAAPEATIVDDAASAWGFWQSSEARGTLSGLALDPAESWALSDLTLERLHRAAEDEFLGVVRDDGTRGFAFRVRDYEREHEGKAERWAEYGVGAWADASAAESLLAAVSRDAGVLGADRTRVLIPESPRAVSDAALAGCRIADEPDFVLAADLGRDR